MLNRRNRKVLPVYLITIILTFVLAGTTAVILFLNIEKEQTKNPANSNVSDELKFIPEAEHSQTVLFIYDGGEDMNDVSFALMRFLPQDESVIFVPIPSNTYCHVNTVKSTVFDFYKKSGSMKTVQAVSEAFGIPVEKYMKFNRDAFNTLVNIFGGLTFSVPQDITYTNKKTGENTNLFSGKQYMDGTILTKMITYPGYSGGEEFRSKLAVNAITDMINQTSAERLKNTLQDSFDKIINCVESNVSAFDFSFRKSSIEYILDNSETPAIFMLTSGKLNDNGQYVLDENFISDVKIKFSIAAETVQTDE